MSIGSLLALVVLAAVAAIVLFNITAALIWATERFRNWRVDGYPRVRVRWGVRENAGGIILTLVMIALILLLNVL